MMMIGDNLDPKSGYNNGFWIHLKRCHCHQSLQCTKGNADIQIAIHNILKSANDYNTVLYVLYICTYIGITILHAAHWKTIPLAQLHI